MKDCKKPSNFMLMRHSEVDSKVSLFLFKIIFLRDYDFRVILVI